MNRANQVDELPDEWDSIETGCAVFHGGSRLCPLMLAVRYGDMVCRPDQTEDRTRCRHLPNDTARIFRLSPMISLGLAARIEAIKLDNAAYAFDLIVYQLHVPRNLRLSLPDQRFQRHVCSLPRSPLHVHTSFLVFTLYMLYLYLRC
jgi:hypothetical protein